MQFNRYIKLHVLVFAFSSFIFGQSIAFTFDDGPKVENDALIAPTTQGIWDQVRTLHYIKGYARRRINFGKEMGRRWAYDWKPYCEPYLFIKQKSYASKL